MRMSCRCAPLAQRRPQHPLNTPAQHPLLRDAAPKRESPAAADGPAHAGPGPSAERGSGETGSEGRSASLSAKPGSKHAQEKGAEGEGGGGTPEEGGGGGTPEEGAGGGGEEGEEGAPREQPLAPRLGQGCGDLGVVREAPERVLGAALAESSIFESRKKEH